MQIFDSLVAVRGNNVRNMCVDSCSVLDRETDNQNRIGEKELAVLSETNARHPKPFVIHLAKCTLLRSRLEEIRKQDEVRSACLLGQRTYFGRHTTYFVSDFALERPTIAFTQGEEVFIRVGHLQSPSR